MCCVDRIKHPGDVRFPMEGNRGEEINVPIVTVIKFQAIARGFLIRNRIKKSHGFTSKPGMMHSRVKTLT